MPAYAYKSVVERKNMEEEIHRQIDCAEASGEMIDNYDVNIKVEAQGDTTEISGVMTYIHGVCQGLKVAELDKENKDKAQK